MRALENKLGSLSRHRKKLAETIINNNCCRNCGIRPGNKQTLQATYALKDDDPCRCATTQAEIYSGDDNATGVQINDDWWYKVYTDGSNQNGTSRELARAGWGVFYAEGSEFSKASKLHGPVQTSYRAELRALLHVVKCSSCRIIVMCDCKSVVNTFNDYQLHGRRRIGTVQEEDLWMQIFDLVDGKEEFVIAKWMPSHLDDPKKSEQKDKAIANGLINEEDIEGNVQADKLADEGVKQHVCNKHHAAFASDRRQITITVQKMMLTVWEAYLENNLLAQEINGYDEQEVEAAMQQMQLCQEEYEDYDPFGHVDADGNDVSIASDCRAEEPSKVEDNESPTTTANQDKRKNADVYIKQHN